MTFETNYSLNQFIVLSKSLFNNNTKLHSGNNALGLNDALAGSVQYSWPQNSSVFWKYKQTQVYVMVLA